MTSLIQKHISGTRLTQVLSKDDDIVYMIDNILMPIRFIDYLGEKIIMTINNNQF